MLKRRLVERSDRKKGEKFRFEYEDHIHLSCTCGWNEISRAWTHLYAFKISQLQRVSSLKRKSIRDELVFLIDDYNGYDTCNKFNPHSFNIFVTIAVPSSFSYNMKWIFIQFEQILGLQMSIPPPYVICNGGIWMDRMLLTSWSS